jgi:outer membrane protein assembly factor BamA
MRRVFAIGAAVLCCVLGLPAAELRVSGLGLLADHRATQTLNRLRNPERAGLMDAGAIEDAALILYSQLTGDGYLNATVTARVTLDGGARAEYPLDAKLEHPLPRPLAARTVLLNVRHGPRFSLRAVVFTGLATLRPAEARAYFLGETGLIPVASERIYSPGRLRRALANLQEALRQRGRAEAVVELTRLQVESKSGEARAWVTVREGPEWRVDALRFDVVGDHPPPPDLAHEGAGPDWTELWRQDTTTAIRRWYYQRGHPDVQVNLVPQAAPPAEGWRSVTVTAQIKPGPEVRLGEVRFVGNRHTRELVLRRLVRVTPGDPLNPIPLDDGLARIARLGVFSNLYLHYDPPTGPTRDVVYQLTEGRRAELALLFGYGSYDELRGGVEWKHYNLFGRANTDNLKLVQSIKSTQADYTYTVPELFGTAVDGSARLFGLRRQELSFVRTEYGANVTFLWPLRGLGTNLTTGYSFQRLRSTSNQLATSPTDLSQANVASVEVGLVRDRRDNPLTPHRGTKIAIELTEASRRLGGQVDFQQLTLSASYHRPVGRGHWIHVGFTHGIVTTYGAQSDAQLPVNVRFFPGGDGSIRGYRSGEAAPRAADGQFIGAKAYLQVNLEFEQALTTKWTMVAFADALGTAVRLADYPFDERLYTVGLGLRYQTLIGPIRLEYGHNLNPRPRDPSGTLLLSLGFPF